MGKGWERDEAEHVQKDFKERKKVEELKDANVWGKQQDIRQSEG